MPQCYLCGADATTIDHVPPRSLFIKVPANIIELPACTACNQGASLDEEYIRTILSAIGYARSAEAREIWEGPVRRSFARRPKGLRARLANAVVSLDLRTHAGILLGRVPGIGIDGKRASRVFRKIGRGLAFHSSGKRLGDDELLLFRDVETKSDFRSKTQGWTETDMGDPFRYRVLTDSEGSGFWFEFYRTHWWLALTEGHAKTYPLR